MPVVDKNYGRHGLMVVPETTYAGGSPAVSTSTDGVLVFEAPVVDLAYKYDGARGGQSTNGFAGLSNAAPSGRMGTVPVKHYWRGPSGAYSSSVFSEAHHLIRSLGFAAGFASSKWTYNPVSTGFTSLSAACYWAGMLNTLTGTYAKSLEIAFDARGVPVWSFELQGIAAALPSDASVPAITYPNQGIAPTAAGMTCTLTNGGVTASLRVLKGSLKIDRAITDREDLTSASHPGFDLGVPSITLDLELEATTQPSTPFLDATNHRYNPYALFDAATAMTVAVQVGSTTLQRFSFGSTSATMQLRAEPKEGKNGTIPTWAITLEAKPAADDQVLDFYIITD